LAGPRGAQPQPSGSPTSSGRYLPAGWRLCGEEARPARTDDERRPCTTCHGTGLITADSEPPDDDLGLSSDEDANRPGLPPLPPTFRHPERMSPEARFAVRVFPSLEACE